MVDEFTGLISQPGATSKSTSALFEPMSKVIKESFNAFGHHVPTLHGDAENLNHALRKPFGAIGTTVVNSLPGDHAHRAERSTRTVQDRVRAVVDGLPYVLPNELNLLADQAVGEALNHSTNKASHPLTPAELTWGLKLTQQPAPFGRCAMVKQPTHQFHSMAPRQRPSRPTSTDRATTPTVVYTIRLETKTYNI